MPRGLFNWIFRDVERFLKDHGFVFLRSEGSHYHYTASIGGKTRLVQVQFHGNNITIKPRTLKSIIIQSGISQKEWISR